MADASVPASLRDRLEATALAGGDWAQLVGALAAAGHCEVRLAAADSALLCAADPDGVATSASTEDFDAPRRPIVSAADVTRAFAGSEPIAVRTLDGVAMYGIALSAGGRRLGLLLVAAGGARAEALLRSAATAVAIVALRRDVQAAAVAETAAWFVDELRFGSRRDASEIATVAQRFAVRLDEEQTAVAIGYDGADLRTFATALSWLETPVRVDGCHAWTLLRGEPRDRLTLIQRRLQSFLGHGRVLLAAGPAGVGAEAIRAGFDRAGFALRMLTLGRVPATRVPGTATFDELGLAGVLFAVPRAELAALVQSRLGPVLDHAELLETLGAWYASGGSRLAVAEAVHIHRNSVGHRMERLRAMLGSDPADPQVALQLRAALVAADVLAASE